MNTTSCDTRRVFSTEAVVNMGDFCIWTVPSTGKTYMKIKLPGEINPPPLQLSIYGWDRNLNTPTLTGLIERADWHGSLTAGRLVSV